MKNTKTSRIDVSFEKYFNDIMKNRFIKGMDKRPLTLPRFTKAITRVPKLKEILEKAKIDGK